jgi:hypothetical protein
VLSAYKSALLILFLCGVSWKETAEAFIDPHHNHHPCEELLPYTAAPFLARRFAFLFALLLARCFAWRDV